MFFSLVGFFMTHVHLRTFSRGNERKCCKLFKLMGSKFRQTKI